MLILTRKRGEKIRIGDSIAISAWADIWLNEGFATYSEWLWLETQGRSTPTESICDLLFDPGLASVLDQPITDVSEDDLFTPSVYLRGGMLLHALRLEIGEESFTELLTTYFSQFSNGNATTPDFIAVAERVSGQQLDDLFDRWLNGPLLPDDFDACP
jgi:aminopeptidase N